MGVGFVVGWCEVCELFLLEMVDGLLFFMRLVILVDFLVKFGVKGLGCCRVFLRVKRIVL